MPDPRTMSVRELARFRAAQAQAAVQHGGGRNGAGGSKPYSSRPHVERLRMAQEQWAALGDEERAAERRDQHARTAEAVRWLETSRGVSTGLKVVSWKPQAEGPWGALTSGEASAAAAVLTAVANGLFNLPRLPASLERLGLDGLVSVWQPSEN